MSKERDCPPDKPSERRSALWTHVKPRCPEWDLWPTELYDNKSVLLMLNLWSPIVAAREKSQGDLTRIQLTGAGWEYWESFCRQALCICLPLLWPRDLGILSLQMEKHGPATKWLEESLHTLLISKQISFRDHLCHVVSCCRFLRPGPKKGAPMNNIFYTIQWDKHSTHRPCKI